MCRKSPHCIELLGAIRSREMHDRCAEHGQMSGMHRTNQLGRPGPSSIAPHLRDSSRSPRKYEREVFARDGFRCRYCGIRLVSAKVPAAAAARIDGPEFQKGRTNLETHGVILAFTPVADHIVPCRTGGTTEPANLVASCGPRNYGKAHYTVEQMGMDCPLGRPPIVDEWNGLESYLDALK